MGCRNVVSSSSDGEGVGRKTLHVSAIQELVDAPRTGSSCDILTKLSLTFSINIACGRAYVGKSYFYGKY